MSDKEDLETRHACRKCHHVLILSTRHCVGVGYVRARRHDPDLLGWAKAVSLVQNEHMNRFHAVDEELMAMKPEFAERRPPDFSKVA
jgi:hypothetical protein